MRSQPHPIASVPAAHAVAGIDVQSGLAGIRLPSRIQLARTDTSIGLLVAYWQSWFLFFVAAAVVVAIQLPRRLAQRKGWCLRLQVGGAIGLFAAAILFFGVRAAPAHYNVYGFLPIYQALAFAGFMAFMSRASSPGAAGRESGFLHRHAHLARGFCLALMCGAALLTCRGTFLGLLAFPYYLASGCDYRSMKPVFARVIAEHPGPIFYSGGLLTLDDEMRGSIYHLDSAERCMSLRAMSEGWSEDRAIVLVEERNGFPIPPHLVDVVLDAKDRGPPPSSMLGLRILRARRGYSFVAFEQDAQ